MNISKFELILHFSDTTKAQAPIQKIGSLLNEDVTDDFEPVISRKENEKFAIRWGYDEVGLIKEDVRNVRGCINKFIKTTETINGAIPIGTLSKRQLAIDWIFPVDEKYNFKQLQRKYTDFFINKNELVRNTFDSSMVLDFHSEQGTLHHQSGAMKIPQLEIEFRTFVVPKNNPKLFLFLETEIENGEPKTYSEQDMGDFIEKSYQICRNHAILFKKLTGAVL
jgi:hypothetical protein